MIFLSALALLLTLILFLFGLPLLENEIRNYYFNKIKWKNRISRNQYRRFDSFFSSRFSYYRPLDSDGRAKFIYRSLQFLQDWKFEARRGLELDSSKKLLVCGVAAQLTYGLEYFQIPHFHQIFLYPDTFYSDLAEAEVKGLTYSTGQVAFSWQDFEEGFRIENDGYNLGLHEMAHALDVNQMREQKTDDFIDLYFADFIRESVPEYHQLNQQGLGFLRERAAFNPHEFFAVCVENFFEKSSEFQKALPNIFNHLCLLLRQNPLNSHENYELRPDYIREANARGTRQIPNYFRLTSKANTSVSDGLFWLLVIPGFFFHLRLIKINPHHTELFNYLALLGGVLFILIRSKSEILKNNREFIGPTLLFDFIRGTALSSLFIFMFSHSVWRYPVHVLYRINESTVTCSGNYCRLKNLHVFDYPEPYKKLSNYQIYEGNLNYFEQNHIPVYFEENSERGMFGIINHLDSKIVAGDFSYPVIANPQ